ncbi:hypothetical protein RHSIM_Rhsim10G0053900 [Rhododendron simsii]|uniref:Protein kinase domain-containing protein n=1 Tax=Rhododendron simsii TaxID=118357 RepID=A0A834LC82_RHOSS|nr:hypothetical protein RHSIM_Rhsim10G0053900 [Rhododendron simsii]
MFSYLLSFALPLCFFFHQSTFTLAINSPDLYSQQVDHVAVNCGSSGNSTAEDTRQWTGDAGSNYITSLHGSKSKLISSKATDQPLPYHPIPYTTARLSRWPFTYTFRVTPGQKIIRLHFYPASYRGGFKRSKALFTVKAGPYTLLSNFSASLTADALSLQSLVKEYYVDVEEDQPLIITFIPSRNGNADEMYAFVNGIEIISIPAALYSTCEGTSAAQIVGKSDQFTVDKSFALEKVHRLNVGGSSISSIEDTPMYRDWYEDSNYLLEKSSVKPMTTTIRIKYTSIPSYTAPQKVYQTSWSMVQEKQVNKTGFNFTWRLPVDLGFRYLLRLHFCELEYEIKESGRMEFSILVNEQVAEAKGDLIKWSGGNGVAVYKDYVVMMEGDKMEGKRDLLIVLRPHNHGWTEPIDATIKGVEVFKLSNPDKNLAGVNPVLLARASMSPKPKKLVFASGGNAIATGVVILLTVLNIIVYQLRSLGEKSVGNLSSSTSEGLCRRFSLTELMLATNNFDDELVIGSGGFGKVYKALIDDGATMVALKKLTKKSDVYAFGVVMLEMLCGRPAVDMQVDEEQRSLVLWAKQGIKEDKLDQLIDPSLRDQISAHCLKVFAEVANKCLDSLPKGRPTMADVVARLEYALASKMAVDGQFGENAERDDSLPRGDAPSSSSSALYSENTQGQNRSKGNVSKVFQRTIKFLAKGADIKLKKRKVNDSNDEQSLSVVSSTRSRLQWNFLSSATVGSKIPRNFSSSAASGGNETYLKGKILTTPDLRTFSFLELKTATHNFSSVRLLGVADFGEVYKGWLDDENGSGSVFAVQKFNPKSFQGFQEWQSYNPKLSDFVLAKMGPLAGESHVTTRLVGTHGYAAPEFIATGHLYVKSHVYGFGVVLVEMLTGLHANRSIGGKNLVDWVKPYLSQRRKLIKILDSRLEGKYPAESAFQMAQVALKCLEPDPKTRPSMKEVVETLEPSYRGGFKRSEAFFTVKAGPYTLLSNFSASLTVDALGLPSLVKEYCVDVDEDQPLIIMFSPSRIGNSDEVYAFVNGIEIISMPAALYHTRGPVAQIIGKNDQFTVDKSIALETVYRLNVGGSSISSIEDMGMFRIEDQANETKSNFTWTLPVDLGFRYLLRLHFCELEYEIKESGRMEFSIFVNEQVAEAKGDLIKWSGGNGVAVYKDYVVMMEGDRMEGKRDLLIELRPHDHGWIEPIDATIKGVEVFKLSNHDQNLAGVNPMLLGRASTSPKPKKLVFGSGGNAIATGIVILLTALNIIFYQLRSLGENSVGRTLSLSTSEGLCRHFSFAELLSATNNFNDELVIGSGGFGKVYKALIDDGATTVALKRLKLKSKQGAKEFWIEIDMLSKLRHTHLVSLLGYCDERNEMILAHVSIDVKGSFGYFDPEYFLTRRLTKKSDVYAFGVVMLEMLCGRPAVDMQVDEKQRSLVLWAKQGIKEDKLDQLIDSSLRDQISAHHVKEFAEVANKCLDSLPKGRPTMADVVVRLENALASERAVNEQFGENAQRDDSLSRGDTPSSSTSATYIENSQGQNRSKGNVSKVFQRTIEFVAKGADIKWKKRKVHDSNGEQALSAVSSTRPTLQWKNVTRQFRRSSVESNVPRNFSSSSASGGKEAYLKGKILTTPDLRIFSFSELKTATKSFSKDRLVREGAFGKVYKGRLDEENGSGLVLAVKKLNPEGFQGLQEWQSEVNFLGRVSHPNLVKLLRYCSEEKELLLVYEFMQKGSLENHLFGRASAVQPLPWGIRLSILIGAARGLQFLHTSEVAVIHRDFKTSNILLDECYNPRISDFGLAKFGPSGIETHVSTRVVGTNGYAAPEYIFTGHLTMKADVYSFGVVLVEMLTGLAVFDSRRPTGKQNLVDWVKPYLPHKRKLKKILDSRLEGKYPSKAAFQIAQVALKCLGFEPETRPSMTAIVETLERVGASNEKPMEAVRH